MESEEAARWKRLEFEEQLCTWLCKIALDRHVDAAIVWATRAGVCNLLEVMARLEVLALAVGLTPAEYARLLKVGIRMPLAAWLKELRLDSYVAVACRHAEDCGINTLSEVRLHIDAFGEAMALNPAEKARLVNGAQRMQTEFEGVARAGMCEAMCRTLVVKTGLRYPDCSERCIAQDDVNRRIRVCL